jgi:hypothetical protein
VFCPLAAGGDDCQSEFTGDKEAVAAWFMLNFHADAAQGRQQLRSQFRRLRIHFAQDAAERLIFRTAIANALIGVEQAAKPMVI